jgi:hypothetical protein
MPRFSNWTISMTVNWTFYMDQFGANWRKIQEASDESMSSNAKQAEAFAQETRHRPADSGFASRAIRHGFNWAAFSHAVRPPVFSTSTHGFGCG